MDQLSEVIVWQKYSRFLPEKGRRETWTEICSRVANMHMKKYPQLADEIRDVFDRFVVTKKVLPSMRSMQFAGAAIEKNNTRIYNCAFVHVSGLQSVVEIFYLLLGGTGVGYSVQKHHVGCMPDLLSPSLFDERLPKCTYIVEDSIEGWVYALDKLLHFYFEGNEDCSSIEFDFSRIRPKGSLLHTAGGKAPGPEPLRKMLSDLNSMFRQILKEGKQTLNTVQWSDIIVRVADCVIVGGTRRSALICLFSKDDEGMMNYKSGYEWMQSHPERFRANISVVLHRGETSKEEYDRIWKDVISKSEFGEPGIFWTSDYEWGTNPCCEISLQPHQFCNLSEINASNITDQRDFNERSAACAFIGTLQAGYTQFNTRIFRPIWEETTRKESLLGVSLTGISSGAILKLNIREAARVCIEENRRVAKIISIPEAARVTCVKPSGTTSLVLGCSSGIHPWHNDYYERRIEFNKQEAICEYLSKNFPSVMEKSTWNTNGTTMIAVFPVKSPPDSIFRNENTMDMLKRVKRLNREWIQEGHRSGVNKNNVSATVSIKDNEWTEVGKWMWDNRETYTGLATLKHDGGSYPQAPFTDCTQDQYERLTTLWKDFSIVNVFENDDNTQPSKELACEGGICDRSEKK